jgi:hypothetical protein
MSGEPGDRDITDEDDYWAREAVDAPGLGIGPGYGWTALGATDADLGFDDSAGAAEPPAGSHTLR